MGNQFALQFSSYTHKIRVARQFSLYTCTRPLSINTISYDVAIARILAETGLVFAAIALEAIEKCDQSRVALARSDRLLKLCYL
jgi:hypothetical protein